MPLLAYPLNPIAVTIVDVKNLVLYSLCGLFDPLPFSVTYTCYLYFFFRMSRLFVPPLLFSFALSEYFLMLHVSIFSDLFHCIFLLTLWKHKLK